MIETLHELLNRSTPREYLQSPLPSPLDGDLYAALDTCDIAQLNEFQAQDIWAIDEEGMLAVFASRTASLAVREVDASRIGAGLCALCLLRKFVDPRDAARTLAPLYDSGLRIGADVDAIFRSFNGVDAPVIGFITTWPSRRLDAKSLKGMGYMAVGSGPTFEYRPGPTR